MKITMYELLGLVKDGKAPKKIMFLDNTYRYDEIDKTYRNIIGNTNIGEMHNLEFYLDDEVEIIEEEKKIPEKLEYYDDSIAWVIDNVGQLSDVDKVIIDKLNEVLDYLKSKGDE